MRRDLVDLWMLSRDNRKTCLSGQAQDAWDSILRKSPSQREPSIISVQWASVLRVGHHHTLHTTTNTLCSHNSLSSTSNGHFKPSTREYLGKTLQPSEWLHWIPCKWTNHKGGVQQYEGSEPGEWHYTSPQIQHTKCLWSGQAWKRALCLNGHTMISCTEEFKKN